MDTAFSIGSSLLSQAVNPMIERNDTNSISNSFFVFIIMPVYIMRLQIRFLYKVYSKYDF